MLKITKLLVITIIIMLLFTGCWDKLEIDERAFIMSAGIDKSIDEEKFGPYTATYEYVNLNSIGKNATGKPRFIITSTGDNLSQITRQILTRTNKAIFLGHTKAIIIGENLAKDSAKFKAILDSIERDPNVGRKIIILISKGMAKDVINIEAKEQPLLGRYISNIEERGDISGRFYSAPVAEILPSLHENETALIGRIMAIGDEIKLSGSAVISNFKFVGWLEEEETTDVLFLRDSIKSDEISVVKQKEGYEVSYIINNAKTKKDLNITEDGEIQVKIDIETEGYIDQYSLETEVDLLKSEEIVKLEKEISTELKKRISKVTKKLQNEFGADVIEIDQLIHRENPELWKEIENDWDEKFKDVKFEVNVKCIIRRIGMIN